MEILNDFGFEPILFVAQIINFIIIFWLLKKFLYKPVLKLLEERKHKIESGLKNAEEAEKKLLEAVEKEENILRKAQTEAKKMIDEAIKEADEQRIRAEESTKQQVALMLKDARDQIKEESSAASRKLESQVGKLAVEFLEKSVKDLFGEKEEKAIMKTALKKIKK
jgi:F-type H+-transporting ATPase subunit b